MNNKRSLLVIAAAAFAIIVSSIFIYDARFQREPIAGIAFSDRQELVVALSKDMPGLFDTDGEIFGYQYDIIAAYADAAGLSLRVVTVADDRSALRRLGSGRADMALTVSSPRMGEEQAVQVYSTSFDVIGRGADANPAGLRLPVYECLKGHRVVVSQGFKASKAYGPLLDSLKDTEVYVSGGACLDIAALVAEGKYDFYVCEKSEAQLAAATNKNIRRVGGFHESMPVWAAFSGHYADLAADFTSWLAEYSRTNEFSTLTYYYFDLGATHGLARSRERAPQAISPYDHVMRTVGEREGADWRLMAAIAYCESRFKPNVVSNRGAKGLMQIMPVVARQFGVADHEVMNPEVNITLAVKLLNTIESMMKLPADIAYADRMSLVLACYNCGIGHVADARRLASRYGRNPNSWDDVAEFLVKKSQPEYYTDDAVRNGRFVGSRQTLAFVKSVMGRYTSYCTIAAK